MADSYTQQHPTVEQTITNNASSLYKQKKQFLANLRTLLGTLSITVVGLLYLKDFSILLFIPKVLMNFFLANPFLTNVSGVIMDDKAKRSASVFLLSWLFIANGVSVLYHLQSGPANVESSSPWLHGYFSLQFIGESPTRTTFELILYDVMLFTIQIVYFCVMCTTDDSKVLSSYSYEVNESSDGVVRSDTLSDGYNGDVFLLTLDIFESVSKVWKNTREGATEEVEPENINSVLV